MSVFVSERERERERESVRERVREREREKERERELTVGKEKELSWERRERHSSILWRGKQGIPITFF